MEHDINQLLLLLQVVSVVNNSVIKNLSEQTDWRLGSILVNIWHVQVIHEVDESFAWWWSVGSTSSLINLRHDDDLECFGISIVVEVDSSSDSTFSVKRAKVVVNDSCLTSTGRSNVEKTFSCSEMDSEKEGLSGCLSSWDYKVLEETFVVLVHSLDTLSPWLPVHLNWVVVVVEALSTFWELDLGLSHESLAELVLVILVKRASVSPH